MGKKKKFEKTKKTRSRRYVVIIPYLLVLALFFSALGDRLLSVGRIFAEIRHGEGILLEINKEKETLESDLALAEDPAFLEASIRRLGYIYPGETVYLNIGAD